MKIRVVIEVVIVGEKSENPNHKNPKCIGKGISNLFIFFPIFWRGKGNCCCWYAVSLIYIYI